MDEIRAFFRQVTGLEPFGDYQIEPAEHLENNQSVILRMPTGSGKSESILCAYLWALKQRPDFPQRMLYGLPMRNLVDSIGQRFAGYQENFAGIGVAIQHGAHAGTPAFYSDIAVATIDQIISAYACTPLGYPIRHGSIPAGAIASSFLTFDEVHTFDPERALQSTLFIVEQGHRLGLPFGFLSATMPDAFVEVLEDRFRAKVIDVEEVDVPVRKKRTVVLTNHTSRYLTSDEVGTAWRESEGSLLVVCNTVQRAQELWQKVCESLSDVEVLLLHSRYTRADRKVNEGKLKEYLGQEPTGKGIVITTQVVEVGLDVSTLLLLTELAPVDALIQRAGRVARWGGIGEIRVFGTERAAPYLKRLVESTRDVLPDAEALLDWTRERDLVNDVLNDPFKEYLSPDNRGRAVYWLGEGAFSGNRSTVSKAIRDNQSCTVSIHDNPDSLEWDVWRLPQIRLNAWVLLNYAKQEGTQSIRKVVVDAKPHGAIDQRPLIGCLRLRVAEEIAPNNYYILSPEIARYEPVERGLVLGESGQALHLLPKNEDKGRRGFGSSQRESWIEHSQNALEVFLQTFLPRYEGILDRLARWWKISPQQFVARVALSVALHDLGKLNAEWQVKINRKAGEAPIAHSGDYEARGKLPPHATVSGYLLRDLFGQWGQRAAEPLIYAIAHHHSVRAAQVPRFHLVPEWAEQIETLLSSYSELLGLWDAQSVRRLSDQSEPTALPKSLFDITDGRAWRTYVVISRLIRFSDRMATGGSEHALLRDEDWLTDV